MIRINRKTVQESIVIVSDGKVTSAGAGAQEQYERTEDRPWSTLVHKSRWRQTFLPHDAFVLAALTTAPVLLAIANTTPEEVTYIPSEAHVHSSTYHCDSQKVDILKSVFLPGYNVAARGKQTKHESSWNATDDYCSVRLLISTAAQPRQQRPQQFASTELKELRAQTCTPQSANVRKQTQPCSAAK